VNSHVLGFDIRTKTQLFDSGKITGLVDIAVGSGPLEGDIFASTGPGELIEINLASKMQTVIGSGESYAAFVMVDPNGSLLVTQADRILRFTPVPEPATIVLFGATLVGLGFLRSRQKVA
jgi:hypothetical protein